MNKTMKIITLLLALMMIALTAAACGAAEKVTVTIDDGGTKSEVEIEVGKTVGDAIETAGITLNEKDECDPAKDEKITKESKFITIKRNANVTIVKDGKETNVDVVGGTVEDALTKAGITLGTGETTDVDLKTPLKEGMVITVIRKYKVTVVVDGKSNDLYTAAKTVKELLDEQKITLGKYDEVSEKDDTKLADDMRIVIKRVTYKTDTKTEEIDYETETQYDSSKPQGTSEVTQEGVKGEKTTTYTVKYVDGKEAARKAKSEKITKQPVNEIIVYGTYVEATSAPAPTTAPANEKKVVKVTKYDDCDGSGHGYKEIVYSDGATEYVEY